MKLAKFVSPQGIESVGIVEDELIRALDMSTEQYQSLSDLLEANDPMDALQFLRTDQTYRLDGVTLLPPVDRQEVWAAGVTYKRSKVARMEESVQSASVYDRVYEAARPELFFKSMPQRVVGHDKPLRIRRDSRWNVPEPELTLVMNSRMTLVGFTIGNDMSSRDIEGENPLYLPQAKVYNQSCAVGPWITLAQYMPAPSQIGIQMAIVRGGQIAFEGTTSISQMARSFEDLISWLGRDNTYRDGVMLLTGTGVVPDSNFTLFPGDTVNISIDGIGTLVNTVVQG